MHRLTDRCEILKNSAVNEKPFNEYLCAQREFYRIRGTAALPDGLRSNPMLTAAGLASVIRHFPVLIAEGELICGHNFGDGSYENLPGDEDGIRSRLRSGGFSEAEADEFLRLRATVGRFYTHAPAEGELSDKDRALDQEMASMGFCLTDNHSVIGYEKVLRLGFEGLLDEVRQKSDGSDFYRSIELVCEAACMLGERYAEAAEKLAADAEEPRRKELTVIASVCRQVPRKPARNFYEAVQSLLFAHIINTWEDGINANSLGRLDQILCPYYRADLDAGRMTQNEAFELICCLWIKLYRDYDVQQSCVGGRGPDGVPQINELSYLMLDATEALGFVRCLSVRFGADTDRTFLRRALEVVGHVQNGIPFFFNDDVMIPALVRRGIAPKDAADYTQIGCVETVIPGKSNPHAVTARCNLLKAVEYALADGYSLCTPGLRPGFETGDPLKFRDYAQFESAVFRQTRHIVESACRMTARSIPPAAVNAPKPYKSLLTEGCLDSGRDFNARGALYDYYQVMLLGIPNLADSLAAVRELVFTQRLYTMADLLHQLKNDFPDEAVRLDFVNRAPKFGNDIDDVDVLARRVTEYACDLLDEYSGVFGYEFHAQPFTFLWMLDHGKRTGATPDGRRSGEVLAYSASPMQGRDFNGFTALINSLSKLPALRTPATTSAIVEVDPRLFTDRNIDTFVDILRSAASRGLCNVQFNVVDADTLLDAQRHPDLHRNLAVRVSGFSQKFYLLDKKLQDHIICRTKHRTL